MPGHTAEQVMCAENLDSILWATQVRFLIEKRQSVSFFVRGVYRNIWKSIRLWVTKTLPAQRKMINWNSSDTKGVIKRGATTEKCKLMYESNRDKNTWFFPRDLVCQKILGGYRTLKLPWGGGGECLSLIARSSHGSLWWFPWWPF